MGRVVTLTTDFGLTGTYVAAMKAVILSINSEAKLVDICHTVRPQNVLQAAFAIGTVYEFFPRGTVHLVVVDPGVGTQRKAVILRTPEASFVAPDNGVLSYVLERASPSPRRGPERTDEMKVPPGLEAFHITRPEFWRLPVSPTFHGRDTFAPVAARLSAGHEPSEFGERMDTLAVLPLSRPEATSGGALVGHVLDVDSFGNLTIDVREEDLPAERASLTIMAGGRVISGLVSTYGEGEGLMALIGSSGYLEIAVKNGSAAEFLNAGVGDRVMISGVSRG